jgi:glycosyltransferase involved in cell wall biosynthesis
MARVAVLFDRFGPYHRARLQAAGQEMDVLGIELAGKSNTYDWDQVESAASFERTTLFPDCASDDVSPVRMYDVVCETLTAFGPDVIAPPGWHHPGALSALRWGLSHEVPLVVMSESSYRDHDRTWWREEIKRRVVSMYSAGLVGGSRHRNYLERLGMPTNQIHLGYDVIDNAHFREGAAEARRDSSAKRRSLGLPSHFFLASSRFTPKKNLSRLIEAFARYRRKAPADARDLVLLGDGPARSAVVQATEENGVQDVVHLPGFKQYEDLPDYYGLAEAFVHASIREEWGLVVNEAMAAGLPVLVSTQCGCAPDLVADGENGYTFDPYDIEELATYMETVAHGTVAQDALGAKSAERIQNWAPEAFGHGLQQAVKSALEAGVPSASLIDDLLIRVLIHR